MPLPDGRVLKSRDFRRYQAIHSPMAKVALRLYQFLASDTPAARSARTAFRDAYLSHPHPEDKDVADPFDASHVDERIRQAFERGGPRTVLAQGPMSPYGLLVSDENSPPMASTVSGSDASSVTSSMSGRPNVVQLGGGITVDPHEVIFLPYALHQVLADALDSNDPLAPSIKLMIIASMCHETAHWFALSGGGHYQHDVKRETGKVFGNVKNAFGDYDRRDWGTDAVEKLFGHCYEMLTFADGTLEVVSSRVLPALPNPPPPCLSLKSQMHLLDSNLPPTLDITQYRAAGRLEPHKVPPWRPDHGFLLVTALEQQTSCHHGRCRIRPEVDATPRADNGHVNGYL